MGQYAAKDKSVLNLLLRDDANRRLRLHAAFVGEKISNIMEKLIMEHLPDYELTRKESENGSA